MIYYEKVFFENLVFKIRGFMFYILKKIGKTDYTFLFENDIMKKLTRLEY